MKIKIFFTLLFIASAHLSNAQTFDFLNGKMEVYNGGPERFYKDLNRILVENKIDKCSQKQSEMFLANIKINEDNKAEVTNDKKTTSCVESTFIEAFNEINKLNNWKRIKEFDNTFNIIYYPIDYFENFKDGYRVDKLKEEATFPGGMMEFRNQFSANLKTRKSQNPMKGVAVFDIDNEGKMVNIRVKSHDSNTDFEDSVKSALEKIKTRWKPEKFRGYPIKSTFRLPLTVSS